MKESHKFYALLTVANNTERGKQVMHKLMYANKYYDIVQKICPSCFRKELKRMHVSLKGYRKEFARLEEHATSTENA